MKPKTMIISVAVALVAVIAAWNLFKPAGVGISDVDVQGAKDAIAQGAQVIDVRTPGEFQLGRIAGALNVPLDQLEAQAAGWNRDATYLVYCATGERSRTAVEILRGMGFTSIRHLAAGIVAWPDVLEKGETSDSQGRRVATDGRPVMIEFFTDS
jgi:rhodanese-related sulfurtransferase